MAYTYSNSGSDEQILKIKDIKTGQLVTEELTDIRFTSIIWNKHSSGFYYEKFPKHDAGINGIYYHNIGSHPSEDQLMYQNTLVPRANFILNISTNKEYLIIHEYKDTGSENNVFIVNLDNISEIMPIYTGYKASYTYLGNNECYYYFLTSINASNNQIIQFNLHDYPHFDEKVLIHEREYVIYAGKLINKHYLACTCIIDASYELLIYDLLDKTEYFVSLPTIGTLGEIQGDFNEPEIFFNFESYLHPTSVFMHRPDQKETLVIYAPKVQNFDVTNYETIKIKYQSKDNTQIPMFISKKKDIQLNGTNATLLYGYGGFKISLTPFFMPVYVLWLLKGGIFCVANIRGGGEYGQKWYDQGRRKNKQNVFDDFISGAEWLINNKYTTSHRLAIMGGSNGGLLVGACLVQRPDLFLGGVICNAGVLDMLRFHKFTIGYYWMSDYGNPELEEDFKYLLTYSPLHNIKKGITYPPTLVLVADTDDRVVPAHGKKFIATLQENDSGQYPILIHIETKAGHGRGKPTMKIIEQYADILTFINKIMSIPP